MTVFVAKYPEELTIVLLIRAEGGGRLGDLIQEIHPGDTAFGKTYEEWSETPGPSVEIDS